MSLAADDPREELCVFRKSRSAWEVCPVKKGLLIVYTGDGKGKTTAALGTALRGLGHGFRVCMIQFVKGPWITGEWKALDVFGDRVTIHATGKGFIRNTSDMDRDSAAAREAWQLAKSILSSSDYDIVILDEITYLFKYGMVEEDEVCGQLRDRRADLHVVLTGRNAPDCLIELADLATEMREIKHPLHRGIKAQRGIEF
jgi:cob(I)alamin adenosyltransferase